MKRAGHVAHRLLVGLGALLVHKGARARLLALARLQADDARCLDYQARCLGARPFGGTGLCRRLHGLVNNFRPSDRRSSCVRGGRLLYQNLNPKLPP